VRATVGLTAAAAVGVSCVCWAPPARAQSGLSVRATVSTRQAEVGAPFEFQLTALGSSGSEPQNPRLTLPVGISARGPSVTSQEQMSISGGQINQRQGITATWTLTASRTGTFRIGPATVSVGGSSVASNTVTVHIVPQGSGGSNSGQPQSGNNPFGNFPGFPNLPGFNFPNLPNFPSFSFNFPGQGGFDINSLPPYPDELKVNRALDPTAFLLARAEPKKVVVGQQVTLNIYAYGHRGVFQEINTSEPSHGDFLAYTIIDSSYGQQQYQIPIGNDVWNAMKVRELALFPIHAGTLTVGPMTMGFEGRGYPSSGQMTGLVRKSRPIQIEVTEPPLAGRPPGYRIGDVGRFTLSASVTPRQTLAGQDLSVIVTLQGTGNLPFKLLTPERRGVEFNEPTTTDNVGPHGSTIGGSRTFSYTIEVDQPGHVDLGAITLPFWDPSRNDYDVARAALGTVDVRPNPNGARVVARDKPRDPLAALSKPRTDLGPPAARPLRLDDSKWFWMLLAFGPLGVVVVSGGVRAGSAARERWRKRKKTHERLAQAALKDAELAANSSDAAASASAVERAVFTAIEGACGLKARAVLREELASTLEERGLAPELASETLAVLEGCDALRFTGAGDEVAPEALRRRAAGLVRKLSRAHRRARGRA
jgi:BatD DUF11 like domain